MSLQRCIQVAEREAADKQALLRAILAANLEIGTVQPMRAATLEETYLKHAGVL